MDIQTILFPLLFLIEIVESSYVLSKMLVAKFLMHDSSKMTLLFFGFSAETKKLEIIWFSIHDQTLVCGIVIHCHDYMILETKKNIYWESLHCKKEDELSHHKHFARKTQFYRYVNQNQDSQFCSQWTYYLLKGKRRITLKSRAVARLG